MAPNKLYMTDDRNVSQVDFVNIQDIIPNISLKPCIYRLNINPTSNPDPFIGGLIVNSASTHPADFEIPLTLNQQSLDIAEPFALDGNNYLTFDGVSDITVNKTGIYEIGISFYLFSTLITPNNFYVFQVLRNGTSIFTGPPAIGVGGNFFDINPLGFPFDLAGFESGSSVAKLYAGDIISVKFYLEFDSCVISLTSNLSITLLAPTT